MNHFWPLLILIVLSQTAQSQIWLRADGLTFEAYDLINSVLGPDGAAQVPDCKHNVTHIWQDYDSEVNRTVFLFSAHLLEDDDRCKVFDRQRTEITPDDGPLAAHFGETVSHSWDFRLDDNFKVSYLFTHLSQIKAVGGNDSMPLVTLQAIKTSDKDEDLMMVIHMDGKALNSTTNSTILDFANLDEFRGHWMHVQQKIRFGWDGAYQMKVTRVSDGRVLLNVDEPQIEMWRYDNGDDVVEYTKPKWGIYRSINYGENLRDEIVKFDNFCFAKDAEYCP